MANYLEHLNMLPEHMRDAMKLYIQKGIPPGSFLTAVLRNDLQGAFAHADIINRNALFEYSQFLYSYAPGGCYGSPDTVAEWIKLGGLEGRQDG